MKSSTALHTVSELDHLRKAWKKLAKRKKSKGCDGVTIEAFAADLDWNLREISKALRMGTYKLCRLRPSVHFKLGSPKPRPLQIPAVRDRVVMKALALYIQPSFDKFDLPCSFAYIKGEDRGVPAVTRKVHELVARGFVHYFEADIVNFFGTVDRSRLWAMFAKQIRHRSLLPILRQCFEQELDNLEAFQLEYASCPVSESINYGKDGKELPWKTPKSVSHFPHSFDGGMVMARSGKGNVSGLRHTP